MATAEAERTAAAGVEAVVGMVRTPLEGKMMQVGATVEELNRLGEQASILFRRLDEQREALKSEHAITDDGGLSPHMDAAHKAWRTSRPDASRTR